MKRFYIKFSILVFIFLLLYFMLLFFQKQQHCKTTINIKYKKEDTIDYRKTPILAKHANKKDFWISLPKYDDTLGLKTNKKYSINKKKLTKVNTISLDSLQKLMGDISFEKKYKLCIIESENGIFFKNEVEIIHYYK